MPPRTFCPWKDRQLERFLAKYQKNIIFVRYSLQWAATERTYSMAVDHVVFRASVFSTAQINKIRVQDIEVVGFDVGSLVTSDDYLQIVQWDSVPYDGSENVDQC